MTATLACAFLAAAADPAAERAALRAAAERIDRWLAVAAAEIGPVASVLGAATGIIVAGSGDGGIVAREIALKWKEAAYRRAEGVAAGEFRHGGVALLDATCALAVIAEPRDGAQIKLIDAAVRAGSAVVTIGEGGCDVAPGGGLLGALVAGQVLALALARAEGIDADAPRGIVKVVG